MISKTQQDPAAARLALLSRKAPNAINAAAKQLEAA